MTTPRPVTDEPVRGVVPPAWIFSLPGIERMRLLARHYLAAFPIARLVGIGIGHVSAGSVAATQVASGHMGFIPALSVFPVIEESLYGAAATALEAGWQARPVTVSTQYFRNPRPQPGNFLGRARVMNSSSMFTSCACDVEDPVGRLVGSSTAQFAVHPVEPAPPPAPATMETVEEATYPTPDPPARPTVGAIPPLELSERVTGLELGRMIVAGELPPLPIMNTFGLTWDEVDEGTARFSMRASEWFCSWTHDIATEAIDGITSPSQVAAVATLLGPGQTVAIIESNARFLRPVKADGRQIVGRARVTRRSGNLVFSDSETLDADGNVVAIGAGAYALIDPRARRPGEPERVLATLLFTDIVGSTRHAERMGDAIWRSLLAEHHALVRQELGAHHGREVNTTGDGFLARFESPAAAIRCAKAIRDAIKRLHLEVRSGIHTGECEVHGNDLAGIAVHVAARVMAVAQPNEIVVSQTVRDLAAGSGLRFNSCGAHALKGVEGEWNLYEVED